ncbi:hypothetical protein HGB13_00435 [bacterium]|nr:hypothetical protein [bacterium]
MSSFADQIEKYLNDSNFEKLDQTIIYLGLTETINAAMSHDYERIIYAQQHLSHMEAIIKIHMRMNDEGNNPTLLDLLSKIKLYSEFHYTIMNTLPDQISIDEICKSKQGKIMLEILAFIDKGSLPSRRRIETAFNLTKSQSNKILYKMRSLSLINAFVMVPKQGYVYRTELGGRKILKMMEFVRNIPALKLVETENKNA